MVSESPIHAKLRMAGGLQGLRPPWRLPVSDGAEENAIEAEAGRAFAAAEPVAQPARGGNSSAERGDFSVAAIRREQAALQAAENDELSRLLDEGQQLEAAGDHRAAANVYSRAAAKVEGDRRAELVNRTPDDCEQHPNGEFGSRLLISSGPSV